MTQQPAPASGGELMLSALREINAAAAFNRWAGFAVVSASAGHVELRMSWRDEVGQYSGFLHAGLIGALIDTACGFAAGTIAGRVLASHYSVNCMAPAVGRSFVARKGRQGRQEAGVRDRRALCQGRRRLRAKACRDRRRDPCAHAINDLSNQRNLAQGSAVPGGNYASNDGLPGRATERRRQEEHGEQTTSPPRFHARYLSSGSF
jgi:acyl-coenzyme A thioesterase PaaI-like protein